MQNDGNFENSLGNLLQNVKDAEKLKIQLIGTVHSQHERPWFLFFSDKKIPGDKLYNLNNLKILIMSRLPMFSNDFGQWIKKLNCIGRLNLRYCLS